MRRKRPVRQSGVVLVIVLWLLALLTVMAGGYSATMRTETQLTANTVRTAQARALAESGIWLGVNELLKPQPEQTWWHDGTPHVINNGADKITIRLQDETGKIDLNTAGNELLQGLLNSTGLDESESVRILNAILDWRDRDNLKRQSGAEDDDYANAGLDYGAKDGPFNSVDELKRVMGMRNDIYQSMLPALTIYSNQPGINPETASKTALLALPASDPTAVDEYLKMRHDNADYTVYFTGLDRRVVSRGVSRTFTVSSEGNVGGTKADLNVVLLLKPRAGRPITILSWRENDAQVVKSPEAEPERKQQ